MTASLPLRSSTLAPGPEIESADMTPGSSRYPDLSADVERDHQLENVELDRGDEDYKDFANEEEKRLNPSILDARWTYPFALPCPAGLRR